MLQIRKKRLILNLIVLFVTLLVCFTFLELCFRIMNIGEVYKIGESDEKSYVYTKHSGYNPFLIFGPNINKNITQKNGEIAVWNSQGFRLNEDIPFEKKQNEYRIIALGGSTTENIPNEQGLHYSNEANRILEDSSFDNKKVNIINSGAGSYTTAHSLIRLQFDLLPFEPDMITVMHNINDLSVNFYPFDKRYNYGNKFLTPPYSGQLIYIKVMKEYLKKSRFIVFCHKSLETIKDKYVSKGENACFSSDPVELKFKDQFRNNLIAISQIAKAHNITVVFISQPITYSDNKLSLDSNHVILCCSGIKYCPLKDEFEALFEEYNKIIKDVAEEENVYYIDMYGMMGHDERYFTDMVHYTPDGIYRFGEIYAYSLEKIIEEDGLKNDK